jgi:hypothetical protein
VLDPEGVELPVSGSVQSQALVAARDALSQKAKKDLGDPDARIDVEDEHGAVIYRLRLRDAFRIE